MRELTRRTFASASLGGLASVGGLASLAGLAAAGLPGPSAAATPCIAGNVPPFVPQELDVDCASKKNFQLFRQYSTSMGLAGIVCRTTCSGHFGTIQAGRLILFPWLKASGQALRTTSLSASLPTGASSSTPAKPIPNAALPQDEYLCRVLLQAPYQDFIGFLVDAPLSPVPPQFDWYSAVPRLSDGKPVGIDWTSANLNGGWFGGDRTIPSQDTCSGSAWRALIVNALNEASTKAC